MARRAAKSALREVGLDGPGHSGSFLAPEGHGALHAVSSGQL